MTRKEEILIQTETTRVRIMELPPGGSTPLHHHSEVTDNIFGLTGAITIKLVKPEETIELPPGSRCEIQPGRIHSVINSNQDQNATYLLVQGVGQYDFLAAPVKP